MQAQAERRPEWAAETRILIVDDEAGARETLTDLLGEIGYRVQAVGTATEALALAQETPFEVALLDVRLPDMSGTELLRQLKALRPELACVMVTAYASVTSTVEALNEGAAAYVMKPFEIPQIAAVIREQAEKQRLARENERMVQALHALQLISDVALSVLDLDALPGQLLERLLVALGGQAGLLILLDDEQGQHRPPVRIGTPQGDEVMRAIHERAPLRGPNEDAATRLGLPLLVHGRCIGGVQVEAAAGHHFTQRDLSLAMLLADRAALALENALLHERERRSAREAQTLFRTAEQLVSTLHLDERVLIIARTLADVSGCTRCLIFLRKAARLIPERAYGITPDEADALRAMDLDLLSLGGTIQRAVETGKALALTDLAAEPEDSRAFLGLWHMRSALVLPLIVGTEVVGVALLDSAGAPCQVSPHDVRLCEAVANQAAVAIENARAFERERNVAEVLQKAFLPPVPPERGGLRLAARYYAALEEAQIGGDFYDLISLPDGRIGLLMADVSGKGVNAAVHAAMGKYMLRAFAFEHPDPVEVIRHLNDALFTYVAHEVFITLFYAAVHPETGEVDYVSAGHPPAFLVRAHDPNRLVRLGSTGSPVGAFRDAQFASASVRMEPGDLLVLYTDGVTEARNGREFFGIERLEDVVAENARRGPDGTADAIRAEVQHFTGRASHDDIALIVAQALPRPTSSRPGSTQSP
ncbi:MAG: SpoIIE family protein phosphatase [Armatimonadetes bacterium]|nr:SpoIIE family protein phosphatase [Armatimonadota bacterium]